MLHMVILLEDTTMVVRDGDGDWAVDVQDSHTGKSHKATLTNVQLGAILALATGLGEDMPDDSDTVAELYQIAEEATKDWPPECRPMP